MKKMMHPLHGFHIVYDGNTEASMRKNGWVDDVPDAPEPAPEQPAIKIDKRWSAARIAAEIEKAKQ